MIKNKILLFICLGMTVQPSYATESLKDSGQQERNIGGWIRSPWVWGTVALAGALGAWVYKKYREFKDPKRVIEQQNQFDSEKGQDIFIDIQEEKEPNTPPLFLETKKTTQKQNNNQVNDVKMIKELNEKTIDFQENQEIFNEYFEVYANYIRNKHQVKMIKPQSFNDCNIFELTKNEHSSILQKRKEYTENGKIADLDKSLDDEKNNALKVLNQNKDTQEIFNNIFIPTIFTNLKEIIKNYKLIERLKAIEDCINKQVYVLKNHKKLLEVYAKSYTNAFNEALALNTSEKNSDAYKKVHYFINLYFLYYKPINTLKILSQKNN